MRKHLRVLNDYYKDKELLKKLELDLLKIVYYFAYLHLNNLFHGDIKIANIMIDDD